MQAIRDRRCGTMLLAAAVVVWAACGVSALPAFAQAAHPPIPQASETPRGAAPAGEPGGRPRAQNDNAARLPADSVTEHTVELPGRTLHFTATAGTIPLLDAESLALQAEVAFVAYTMGSPGDRPVTFLFNGGPGAASAYLDIGAGGPWRLAPDSISVSGRGGAQPHGA